MRKYKNIGLVIVILLIGFNVYDYFKIKSNLRGDDIEKCSEKFRLTNPYINKKVADEYCSCVFESIGDKYKNSNIGAEKILDNEKLIMQDCFDKVKDKGIVMKKKLIN